MQTELKHAGIASATVAALAIENPHAIEIFKKYNIDFCCGGQRPFDQVCREMDLNAAQILEEIDLVQDKATEEHLRFNSWSAAFLTDYIVENHHQYVKSAIPELLRLLAKTAVAHGEEDVELISIHEKFNLLSEELLNHLEKEEKVLFPMIKELKAQTGRNENAQAETLETPIQVMLAEHDTAGELIQSIRFLSNNYTVPAHACPTYTITYKKLKEFDDDLMKHIHLENNILFKKVTESNF